MGVGVPPSATFRLLGSELLPLPKISFGAELTISTEPDLNAVELSPFGPKPPPSATSPAGHFTQLVWSDPSFFH